MCGLAGVLEFTGQEAISRQRIAAMSHTIAHRGPDDEGLYVGPGIGLGFRRLSIIDLAGGHQPLSNEDGTIWVMLNGEIYNFQELRDRLLAGGHQFASASDTEVIAHLYEDRGEACFAELRGMFAIAVWDSRRRRLLLARDRVGKKPLFYAADRERIVFGSELKALFAGAGIPRDIDAHALADYFSLGYIPNPKTIYRAVRKVRPGHYLVASAEELREVCYWDLSFGQVEDRTEEEWCERLREGLHEATRVRLMSDVPLGAFLSGGLDSSSVVATMSQLMTEPVVTCSIGFEEEEFSELEHARAIAQKFATQHHEHLVRPDAIGIVDQLVWHYDEPFADSSAIPTYYVSHVARQHVTVALGGDGGDENFAGYRRYYFDQVENRLRRIVPAWMRRPLFAPLGRWYPGLAWAPRVFRARATFQSFSREPLEGYFTSVSCFRPDERRRLFTGDFRRALGGYDSIEVFRHHYARAGTDDPLSRIQYVDIKTYLTDDILTKVDRASMAVSLEVRAPILDHRLMEMVATIPSALKLKGREGKYILKKALEPVLPLETVYRPKQGFAVPLGRWFRRELREMAYETIFARNDGILDARFLKRIWDQHQKGYYDRSAHLWAVLMYRKWQERFLDDQS